jgi:hypothetical protein
VAGGLRAIIIFALKNLTEWWSWYDDVQKN